MNIGGFPYIFIDPASGGFSCSRFGLFLMNTVAVIAAFWLLYAHQYNQAVAVITGLAGTDAGVYFASTRKEIDTPSPNIPIVQRRYAKTVE